MSVLPSAPRTVPRVELVLGTSLNECMNKWNQEASGVSTLRTGFVLANEDLAPRAGEREQGREEHRRTGYEYSLVLPTFALYIKDSSFTCPLGLAPVPQILTAGFIHVHL